MKRSSQDIHGLVSTRRATAAWAVWVVGLCTLTLVGCGDGMGRHTYSVSGLVQKGPFIRSSSISIQEMNAQFEPTGTTYETETIDNYGSFAVSSELGSSLVDIRAQGFYFDEVAGELSSANLTCRVLADLSFGADVNINILTTLERERVRYLVREEGRSFDEAKQQAKEETLQLFSIPEEDIGDTLRFEEMDISEAGDGNAILLAISVILQGDNSVAQLSELISKLSEDLAPDGVVDDPALLRELAANALFLDAVGIRRHLEYRYSELGATIEVPDFEPHVEVFVLENSLHPVLLGSVAIADSKRVFADGSVAYVVYNGWWDQQCDSASGLAIVDVADPASPRLLTDYPIDAGDMFGPSLRVHVSGNHAYVADGNHGLLVLDVSDAAAPAEVARIEGSPFGFCSHLLVAGDRAYWASGWDGFLTLDVSQPDSPTVLGHLEADESLWLEEICLSEDYVFVAEAGMYWEAGDGSLQVIDVSDPDSPAFVGNLEGLDDPWSVSVHGDYAYVADSYNGLVVIDISDPTQPVQEGSVQTGGEAFSVAATDRYVFLADTSSGLVVVDAINPSTPTIVGTYNTGEPAYGVTVVGDLIYLASDSGLRILSLE